MLILFINMNRIDAKSTDYVKRNQSCRALSPRVQLHGWTRNRYYQVMEDATMPRVKQASKSKRVTKAAVPALGAAGLTFSLVGGASAAAVPTADGQRTPDYGRTQHRTRGDEELAAVSLATLEL